MTDQCPWCKSTDPHIRKDVRVVTKEVWRKDEGSKKDSEYGIVHWPCWDQWHCDGMQKSWNALSPSEQRKTTRETNALLGSVLERTDGVNSEQGDPHSYSPDHKEAPEKEGDQEASG